MLNKARIIEILYSKDWPLDQYWICSGAGLVLHGVKKETRDIDIGCTSIFFEQLLKSDEVRSFEKDNIRALEVSDGIEIFENWNAEEIIFIEGLPVATLESIKKHKLELGRKKDISDIAEIEKYMKNTIHNIK